MAIAPIVLGSPNAVEQPRRFGWSPTRGPYTIRTWRGPYTAIISLIPSLRFYHWTYEISGGIGQVYQLEARQGGDELGNFTGAEVTDNWELLPNKVEKDILESNNAIVNSLTAADVNDIKHYLQTPPQANSSPAFTHNAANCLTIYNLMSAGVTHWRIMQPVLRHTWMVPIQFPFALALANLGRILSTATLISSEGVPSDFLLALTSLPTGTLTRNGIGLAYGWFKNTPTLNLSAYARREIHAEWEFGLWSTDLYGAVI